MATNTGDDVFRVPRIWSPESHHDRCFYYDVFLSHARDDGSKALVDALRGHGLRVWYDEQQEMSDRLWSPRITAGLQLSRSVLCFIGSQPLEEHEWVRTEVTAAQKSAEEAEVERVFLAHACTDQDIPSWLRRFPVDIRYECGEFDRGQVRALAKKLRGLNRVEVQTSDPPHQKLLRRANAVHGSRNETDREHPGFGEDTALSELREFTSMALGAIGRATSLDEINKREVGEALCHVRLPSDRLCSPPSRPITDNQSAALGTLAEDLGLLTSLTLLDADTRGFPYVVLSRLAHAGATQAFDVLRSCLRWEPDSSVVDLLAETLAAHPQHRDRDDALLVLLKGDARHDSWPLEVARSDDGAARLRYHARKLTAESLQNLGHTKRGHELDNRVAVAAKNQSASGLEIAFREALPISGLTEVCAGTYLANPGAPADSVSRLPSLIVKCVRDWPTESLVSLWWLPFEMAVFSPLEVLSHYWGPACGAARAMARFATALEGPVNEHEMLLERMANPNEDHLLVKLAQLEVQNRRRTIQELRRKSKITRDEDRFRVEIYPGEYRRSRTSERDRLRALLADGHGDDAAGLSEAEQRNFDIAKLIVSAWKRVPDC